MHTITIARELTLYLVQGHWCANAPTENAFTLSQGAAVVPAELTRGTPSVAAKRRQRY